MVLFALTILLAASVSARPRVATEFCDAIPADSVQAFEPLAASPEELRGAEFESVRDLIAHYDKIEVERCEATSLDPSTIVIDFAGRSVTRNAERRRTALTGRWYLTLSKDGRITSAADETMHVVELLLAAQDDGQRASVLAASNVRTADVARALVSRESESARDAAMFLLARDGVDAETETYALCTLGAHERRAQQRAQAAHLFDRAMDLATVSGSCDAEATAIYLAASNTDDGDAKTSLLKRAANTADSLNDPRPALKAIFDQGSTRGTDLAALTQIADSLDVLARRYGSVDAAMLATSERAVIFAQVNDETHAVDAYLEAIALAKRTGDSVAEAREWANLGLTYGDMGEKEKSADAYRNAISLAGQDTNAVLIRSYAHAWLGVRLVEKGELAEAETHLKPAFDLPAEAKWNHVFPLLLLVMLRHAQGRLPEAASAARKAIAIDPTSLSMIFVFQMHLGDILRELGDLHGAVDAYQASIDLVEARRANSTANATVKARHFASRAVVYQRLEKTLLTLGQSNDAFAVAERLKARALTDSLAGADSLQLTPEERKEHHALSRELLDANEAVIQVKGSEEAEARRRQHAVRTKLDAFEERTAFRHATFEGVEVRHAQAAADGAIDPVSLTKSRKATVIEYCVLEDSIAVFVVRNGRITARRIASPREIEAIIRRLRDEVQSHDLRAAHDSERLYEALLSPVEDLLPPDGEIVIVPDGMLWNVPFAALRNRRHQFVIEKYAVSYAPSITMLDRTARRRQRASSDGELLALGNPYVEGSTRKQAATYRGLSLGPLPDAEREVRAIAALYGANRSKVLVEGAATETAFKQAAGTYRVIHLATHGILDGESPLYSALVLSRRPSDQDDGLLEMREMTHLHLHADLVVLSACDTGAGDIYPGEGIIGMSWAMLAAGCSQVIVSQWMADSRATSELMIEFHRQWKHGRSAPDALRHAELKLLKSARYSQPFYWAPFIVVGGDH